MTSSFIIGLNQMIAPFKWCFSMIPILPGALLDMLDAPVPLIAGITPQQYDILIDEEIIEEEELYQKVWIKISNKDTITIENMKPMLDQGIALRKNQSMCYIDYCCFGGLEHILEQIRESQDTRQKVL